MFSILVLSKSFFSEIDERVVVNRNTPTREHRMNVFMMKSLLICANVIVMERVGMSGCRDNRNKCEYFVGHGGWDIFPSLKNQSHVSKTFKLTSPV